MCGHKAWRIAYGMIMPSARQEMPKTEFAGCCIAMEVREYPSTGKAEVGTPKWGVLEPKCWHSWW